MSSRCGYWRKYRFISEVPDVAAADIRNSRYWTAEDGLVTEVDADAMEVEAEADE